MSRAPAQDTGLLLQLAFPLLLPHDAWRNRVQAQANQRHHVLRG